MRWLWHREDPEEPRWAGPPDPLPDGPGETLRPDQRRWFDLFDDESDGGGEPSEPTRTLPPVRQRLVDQLYPTLGAETRGRWSS